MHICEDLWITLTPHLATWEVMPTSFSAMLEAEWGHGQFFQLDETGSPGPSKKRAGVITRDTGAAHSIYGDVYIHCYVHVGVELFTGICVCMYVCVYIHTHIPVHIYT